MLDALVGITIDGLGRRVSRAEVSFDFEGESDESSRMSPLIAHFVLVSDLSSLLVFFFTEAMHFQFPGNDRLLEL